MHHVALAGGAHQLCGALRHGHQCAAALLRGPRLGGADERRGEPEQDLPGAGEDAGQSHPHGPVWRDQTEWQSEVT